MEYRGKIENANDLVNKKYVDDSISGLATEASVTAIAGRVSTIEGKESGWDAKYSKPSGGIPKSDLASAVQTSLGKADSAVQPNSLAAVATSGSYNDLSNKPTIPSLEEFTAAEIDAIWNGVMT